MFRYTEEELRRFIMEQLAHWDNEQVEEHLRGDKFGVEYARGSADAYEFVLTFMNEYRLEEVANVASGV